MADTGSPFYRCQTGIPPIISGAALAAGVRRHEGGAENSHFAIWREAWGTTPANNYGLGAEEVVALDPELEDFNDLVQEALDDVLATLDAAQFEPCPGTWDDACNGPLGEVNYDLSGCP